MAERRPDRTLGGLHDEFWAHCGRGELRVQRCGACRELQWPVAGACESCGATDLSFVPLSGRGRVISWATFERDYYRGALPIPWDTILVELEEGPLFISNPRGFTWRDIVPDMPVRLAFIDARDSAGPFRLPVFERI
ncbi:MAG: zinc ribbon domain-containing protein [Sphingobium sp.]